MNQKLFSNEEKAITLCWWAFIISLVLVYASGYILSLFLPQDTSSIPDIIKSEILTSALKFVRPEPTERTIYLTTTLMSPFIVLFSILISKVILSSFLNKLTPLIKASSGLLLIFCFYCLLNFPVINNALGLNDGTRVLPCICLLLSLLPITQNIKSLNKSSNLILNRRYFYFFVAFFACISSLWRIYSIGSVTFEEESYLVHLNAVIYAQSQAIAGKFTFLDFPSQYGSFLEFLVPWFRITGLSILTFTATMATLHAIATISILYFLANHITNLLLYCLSATTLILFSSLWYSASLEFEPYFQYSSIRYLCPALAINLFYVWSRNKSATLTLAISLFCGFALIWNLDSGVAIAGTWLGLQFAEFLRPNVKKSLRNLTISILGILTFILLFYLYIYLKSGYWISWKDITRSQWIFFVAGLNMLPIPLFFHPWMLIISIYILGLVLGICHIQGKLKDEIFYSIFYNSILGIGLFTYYQGRSHDYCLTYVLWPAIIIMFILAQKILDRLKGQHIKLSVGLVFLMITSSFGALSAARIYNILPTLFKYTKKHIAEARHPISTVADNAQFIANSLGAKKECTILSFHDAVYFAENGLASSIKGPGLMEVLLKSDIRFIKDQLSQSPPLDLFIGQNFLIQESNRDGSLDLKQVISNGYIFVGASKSNEILYFTRRTNS